MKGGKGGIRTGRRTPTKMQLTGKETSIIFVPNGMYIALYSILLWGGRMKKVVSNEKCQG